MQCVILAAGKGVRMRPLTDDKPKPLVTVTGRPILAHIIAALPEAVDELVVVVKYRAEQIREYLGDTYNGLPVTYAVQDLPDGTGGGLLAAKPCLHGRFLVVPGDDLHGAHALQEMTQHSLAVLATTTDTPERFGVLTLNTDGTMSGIEEKPEHPQTNLVAISVYVLDDRVFLYDVPLVNGELYLTDMVTALAADAPIHVVEQPQWRSVGRPEDIPRAERFLSSQ